MSLHGVRTPLETGLKRRHVLAGAGGVGVAAALSSLGAGEAVAATATAARWSDPATWGGQVPAAGSVVTVKSAVLLDVSVSLAGLVIAPGASLTFTTGKSVTLTSTGNVVVYGALVSKPASATVLHRIVFTGVDERKYVGGGMDVLPSDVGLWVKDAGTLDLAGTVRTPWVRAAGSVPAGATTVTLQSVPTGWRVGDELVITPTSSPRDTNSSGRFDEVTIKAISGNVVTLSKALLYAHPAIAVGDGKVLTSEVLNLTRNVRIEGTASGRVHTWVGMTTRPSSIKYTTFRHFGPRQVKDGISEEVLGRYGLHLHMGGDAMRGTVTEGIVARDGGNHSVVTHLTNGVTHTGAIAYNVAETAFWWDNGPDTRTPGPPSNDIRYLNCVAAKVLAVPAYRGYRLAGFELGVGAGNIATGCVAVGVQGTLHAAGFNWPEGATNGVWTFRDCVTHNNKVNGIFTWQNSKNAHVVTDFVGYHNGAFGISHGAYKNGYVYRDGILFGNLLGGIELHATSMKAPSLVLERLLIDGAGLAPYGIEVVAHTLAAEANTVIRDCRFFGYKTVGVAVTGRKTNDNVPQADLIDIVGCQFSGQEVWLGSTLLPDSVVTLTRANEVLSLRPLTASTASKVTSLASADSADSADVTSLGTFSTVMNAYVVTTPLAGSAQDSGTTDAPTETSTTPTAPTAPTTTEPVPTTTPPAAPAPTKPSTTTKVVTKVKRVVKKRPAKRRKVRARRRRR